jgi:hypothetical protein
MGLKVAARIGHCPLSRLAAILAFFLDNIRTATVVVIVQRQIAFGFN